MTVRYFTKETEITSKDHQDIIDKVKSQIRHTVLQLLRVTVILED